MIDFIILFVVFAFLGIAILGIGAYIFGAIHGTIRGLKRRFHSSSWSKVTIFYISMGFVCRECL